MQEQLPRDVGGRADIYVLVASLRKNCQSQAPHRKYIYRTLSLIPLGAFLHTRYAAFMREMSDEKLMLLSRQRN